VKRLDDDSLGSAVSRFMRVTIREVGDWASGDVALVATTPADAHLLGPGGGVRAGALLTMIDNVGGLSAGLASLPDAWVVSTSMMLRSARLGAPGPLLMSSRVMRAGRTSVVAEVRVDGGDGLPVAGCVLTSAVLVPDGGAPEWDRPVSIRYGPDDAEDLPPILEWIGIRTERTANGVVAIADLTDALRNPWGILHGGVTATLVDAAGEAAVQEVIGRPAATADCALHYLAPGRVGPVAADATLLGKRPDGHVVRVDVHDLGADRLVAAAITTVREV